MLRNSAPGAERMTQGKNGKLSSNSSSESAKSTTMPAVLPATGLSRKEARLETFVGVCTELMAIPPFQAILGYEICRSASQKRNLCLLQVKHFCNEMST